MSLNIKKGDILAKIGLPAWVSDDQTPNYIAIKEEKAEKGIYTLSLLSQYYPRPLIVCFDQLEGLREDFVLNNLNVSNFARMDENGWNILGLEKRRC